MRLERIFTHRIIRLLRVVLPLLVIGLVAVPAWNYYGRLKQKNTSARFGTKLPSGVSVRTDGFTYSRVEGGRTEFTVHARQSLGFKDEKYILRDVDVTIYGAKQTDPNRNIRGKNCTYDQATNDFTCDGNVEVQLDERSIVRTENVIYNHTAGLVTAPKPATIDQGGTTARANSFEYDMNTGLLKLNGDVIIHTADQVEIQTGAALFQQKENWTSMSGGLLIKSSTGWIRGLAGRADLAPVTYKPKTVTVEGNVAGESQPKAGREAWKLQAGWLEATISETGNVEQARTRENVEIEKISGDTYQRITGSEVDTTLKDGKVDALEARQNARMVMGSDQTLQSSKIWTNAAGSVQTTDNSILKVGDSTIQGRDFVIENGGDIVTFNTLRRATLKKDGGQESSSDQTSARFDGRTSMLLELVQRGNFQFHTTQYDGHAQIGRFEEGGTILTFEGSSVVSDSEKRLEASQIRVNQKDNSFVATKNVSTVIKGSSPQGKSPAASEKRSGDGNDQVLVKSAQAAGGADSMLYTGNVQLWRGDVYIKAEKLSASGRGRQDGKVHAEAAPGGKVQSNMQNIRSTSDTLDYDDALGVVHYLGHVRAQKQDMILEAPDVTVNLTDNNVTEIVAIGGVVVTRVDQHGTGERVVYDAATDVVTLTGKNAQVRDKEHGLVQGSRLTINNKGQTALIEGGDGERTITKHSIKNDKK